MDFRFTAAQEKFRKEFTIWLNQNLPADWDPDNQPRIEDIDEERRTYQDFQKKLSDGGYASVHYPRQYGGQGKNIIEEIIVAQTIATTCQTLRAPGIITHAIAMPTILACGTEEQKKALLPKSIDGTHIWCQGFSEPNAGSDVANVQTMALKEANHYIVNGQKVWTSYAHMADYCLLLVRTDPDSVKHQGLSYLLVDMESAGIDVRPMKQITGESEFNEVFFDNVKVPVENLLGQEGEGWKVVIATLMFERTLGDVVLGALYEKNVEKLIQMAGRIKCSGRPLLEDPVARQKLGQAYIEVMTLKQHGLRNLSNQLKVGIPGPEGSMGKLLWSESNQKITEAAIGMQGPNGLIGGGSPWSIQSGFWQYHFLRSKGNTIEAGTSEIQRNIIGERVLGLPKDISRIRDKEV
jgi:alkylation response protein AidB-like acyl-CoA dehydrogenase